MTVSIKVSAAAPIEAALHRLNRKVRQEMGHCWHKRRFGHHEKPSPLKRKAQKMQRLALRSGRKMAE